MSATWTTRYRFRLATRLAVEGDTVDLQLGDRSVTLRARTGGPLRDARYLVLLAKGFDTEAEARARGLARDCPRYSGGRYAGAEREAARGGATIGQSYRLPGYC